MGMRQLDRSGIRITALCIAAHALLGCALPPMAHWPRALPREGADLAVEIGTASWYGPGFHGSPTSSGEIYDQNALSAAHPSLPLGSRVRVTNLENGRSVELRINDRGPFVDDRIIDLSYAAARRLAIVDPGTARVSVERLSDDPLSTAEVAWAMQAAAFRDPARADAFRDRLRATFPSVTVRRHLTDEGPFYRVRVGPFSRREQATAQADALDRLGIAAIVVEEVVR